MSRGESLARTWRRRALSLPLLASTALATLVLLPTLPLWALCDLILRRRFATVRFQLTLTWLAWCEVAGLLASLALWPARLAGPEPWLRLHYSLQAGWLRLLWAGTRRIYGIRLEVEGEVPPPGRGPLLVLARHASVADSLLPGLLLPGWRLRYVLKDELRWDPCLDVVGSRLPNAFVRRGSGREAVAAVEGLALGLGAEEGVLIFPEGTRFSPAKRERVLLRLREEGRAALARFGDELRHVLPPRAGGTLALLDAQPAGLVLLLEHSGFEGAVTLDSLWRGALIGRRVRVRLRTFPRASLPLERAARQGWLEARWREVDAWVASGGFVPRAEPLRFEAASWSARASA